MIHEWTHLSVHPSTPSNPQPPHLSFHSLHVSNSPYPLGELVLYLMPGRRPYYGDNIDADVTPPLTSDPRRDGSIPIND